MSVKRPNAGRWAVSIAISAGLLLGSFPVAYAGPGDVNSVNDGKDIQGGQYYNTPGQYTEFHNSAGTGLYLHQGDLVRGTEVIDAASKTPTGNGGSLFFNAPGQVVRLDGNIDVSGVINGGNVRVDSAFLYQGGQIFANGGANAGSVQMNVGNMVAGPNALIQANGATGTYGADGNISIKSTGAVNINQGAIIDANGNFIGSYNTSVINISGGIVNLNGVVTASALNAGNAAGTIGITATGNTTALNSTAVANAATDILSAQQKADFTSQDATLRSTMDGNVNIGATGRVAADGAAGVGGNNPVSGTNGGIVRVAAMHDIVVANGAHVSADGGSGVVGWSVNPENGGSGGLVMLAANHDVINNGRLTANGGDGSYNPVVVNNAPTFDFDANGRQIFVDSNGNHFYQTTSNGQTVLVDAQGNTCFIQKTDAQGNVSYVDGNGGAANVVASQVQYNRGQDGGNGGNGGAVLIGYGNTIQNNGTIEVTGGNGGNGQDALSDTVLNGPGENMAYGGNGGNAGNGGYVEFVGGPGAQLPSQASLNNVKLNGGEGGAGGQATIPGNSCGCVKPGTGGACGAPGQLKYSVLPKKPPNTPPNTPPQFPPYPKEYPRLGDTLAPGIGQVLSYNRSIFLARAPLPIVKKKPVPRKSYTQLVPPPVVPAPKPKPPQKKQTVRGYW